MTSPVSTRSTTPVAALVARTWAAVLGFEGDGGFGADDDFFALGGDSLDAAATARGVGEAAGVQVPPRTLHDHPRFMEFVSCVETLREPAPVVPARPDHGRHPLGPGQERLWLLSRLHPDRSNYTVPTIVDFTGRLDRTALSKALTALVTRHEPLRTVVEETDAGTMCRVRAPRPVSFDLAEAADEDAARQSAADFLARPFRLADEPPFRARLVEIGPERSWLVLAAHHIATDAESVRIMLTELGALYRAAVGGAPLDAALPPITTAYGDLATWHADRASDRADAQDADLAAQVERRAHRLSGSAGGPLALEGPDPDRPCGIGHRHTHRLGRRLTEAVRAAAGAHRTTVFVTLLAAFAEIAARWSGEDDLCVGYPMSVREPAQARDLMGFFVDTQVIRTDLSGRPTFAQAMEAVHDAVLDAGTSAIPYDVLAEAVATERRHRDQLFRVWFNHLGAPEPAPELPGVAASIVEPPVASSLFEVGVYVTEHDEDLQIDLVLDAAVGTASAGAEMLDQYVCLLTAAVTERGVPLRAHRLRTRLAAALPDPADPLPARATPGLARRLARAVRQHASSVAVSDASGAYTYADLRAAVAERARALRAEGARSGDTVPVCVGRSSELVVRMLAGWAVGGRLLMLDPGYPSARRAAYTEAAREARAPGGRAGGDAYVAFTSGSTGRPACVVGGFEPIGHFLSWYAAEFALGPHDRYALLSGISHDPLYRDVLLPLTTGARLCVPTAEAMAVPGDLAAWLRSEQVTVAHLTPPLARILMDTGIRLPALRLLCLAGDTTSAGDVPRLREFAPHAVLVNGYGTTETPQIVSRRLLSPGQPPTLGATAPGHQLLVVDPDGAPCGIGQAGDLVVRSRRLARRLDRNGPEDDAVAGVQRFRTGDRGRYRTDGSVEYLGRSDGVVKIRGFRVDPAEADRVLATDRGVAAAATIVRDGPDGPELVSCVVAPGVPAAEIRARLASQLPAHLVPTAVVKVERMPLTAHGKIDRKALAALPAVPTEHAGAVDLPEGNLETRLARIWSAVLGLEHIDVTSTFFDLGGTSLKMLRAHAAICRELDERTPLLALYQNPSIRALARHLAGGAALTVSSGAARGSASGERSRRLAARRGHVISPKNTETHGDTR